jgi:hypothetical protein
MNGEHMECIARVWLLGSIVNKAANGKHQRKQKGGSEGRGMISSKKKNR